MVDGDGVLLAPDGTTVSRANLWIARILATILVLGSLTNIGSAGGSTAAVAGYLLGVVLVGAVVYAVVLWYASKPD